MTEKLGFLAMAYGTPADLDDVERYYTDIRHGKPPAPEQLEELTERYRAIGGRSPLLDLSLAQVRGIEQRLEIKGYFGQKHSPPFIAEAVAAMAGDGIDRAAGLVLAPHYSSMSVGDYERRARRGAEEHAWNGKLEMISSWHLEPAFIEFLADRVAAALEKVPADLRARTAVVFTAHSLPAAILNKGDPYPDQLRETAVAVAARVGLERWQVAWQSASGRDWLGPDLRDVIDDLAKVGRQAVVVCPCGFVADHLEVLYDIDIEAKQHAERKGLKLVRTESPNDDPRFLDLLAHVVRKALELDAAVV